MLRLLASVMFSAMCLGAPTLTTAVDTFDPDQPFQQALSMDLLRSLLSQALDRLEDHVEISSNLSPDDLKSDRPRSLRFKYYPEGKSKSERHLSAEGWFSSAPESGQLDWHFRFKLPEERTRGNLQRIENPL